MHIQLCLHRLTNGISRKNLVYPYRKASADFIFMKQQQTVQKGPYNLQQHLFQGDICIQPGTTMHAVVSDVTGSSQFTEPLISMQWTEQ